MSSLYAQYIKERQNKEILEDERGFATYLFINNDIYVEDLFVSKVYRNKGVAKEMLDKISIIAKDNGCKKIIGTCIPSTNGSTESLQAALSYGFKLDSSKENIIIYFKEV